MQSKSLLKKIEQKNINSDLRKISLQSIQTNTEQPQPKNIFLIQPPSYHSQLPAFINRKVKNLKPYTNHFKRFNVQTQKIAEKEQHINKKIIKTNDLLGDKNKTDKSSLLKKLGIQQDIKPTQILQKMAEISVYDQFLEKTSTIFSSNAIQQMYRQSLKKHQRNTKELYQRSNRLANSRESREKIIIPRQQRRSIGGMEMKNERQQFEGKGTTQHGIKSMNQLPKTQQNVLRSDKVCIIPTLVMNLHNEDMVLKQGLKYMETLKKKKSNVNTAESIRKVTEQNVNENGSRKQVEIKQQDVKIKERMISVVKGEDLLVQKEEKCTSPINAYMQQPSKSNIESKLSPSRQQKGNFNLKIEIKLSSQQKGSNTPFVTKKSQKEVTTINVDKTKPKPLTPQFSLPVNVTAFSYIVYEPSFSQNNNSKLLQQHLANTNKIFSNNRVLASLNCKNVVEIASLTKIMTFLLTLEICERLKLEANNEKVRIGKFQANINGTSAQIKEGEIYTVEQLYYGLMLPSGNDASLALATWGGKKLLIHQIKQKQKFKKKSVAEISPPKNFIQQQSFNSVQKIQHQKIILKKKKCYDRFILQMNKKARCLGMTKTTYANSHGLSNNLNKSCAFDLCILCEYGMNNEKFRKVVSTIEYKSTILYQKLTEESTQKIKEKDQKQEQDDIQHENEHSDEESTQSYQDKQQADTQEMIQMISQRQKKFSISQINFIHTKQIVIAKPITYCEKNIFWQNTHKLLSREQYIGIKTGITNTAGPCLASCIKTKENRCFIIIVLNSKKLNYRFKDTEALRKWVYKREKLIPVRTKKIEVQSSLMNYHDDNLEVRTENNEEPKEEKKAESQR